MKLLLVTDAWSPQINGVVTTLSTVKSHLEAMGHEVRAVTPDQFKTFPCPTYPEIRLAVGAGKRIAAIADADAFRPSAVHIATEGPLGLAARGYCLKNRHPFTTSFHTRFPEYVEARTMIPASWTFGLVRWFHRPAAAVMVATPTVRAELKEKGFANTVQWSRGVDVDLFHPRPGVSLPGPRPILLYVGRVAVEKNLRRYLALKNPGTKYVVGDGPELERLKAEFPQARFVGAKRGEELACHFAAADVFVFPSRTDTFGLVLLEALASGVPVAAYPVPGPKDILDGSPVGCLDEDLGRAVEKALSFRREACRDFALAFSWRKCSEQFLSHLSVFR
jgi:glycosyltransferase involved in cell wall biosynthesis